MLSCTLLYYSISYELCYAEGLLNRRLLSSLRCEAAPRSSGPAFGSLNENSRPGQAFDKHNPEGPGTEYLRLLVPLAILFTEFIVLGL